MLYVFMCDSRAVLIMRIYYGTVDNECNMHVLVGGIIHQVGQVAVGKDCNSAEPSSFQSSAQCTNGARRTHFSVAYLPEPRPPEKKKINKRIKQ